MKKIIISLFICLSSIFFISCTDSKDDNSSSSTTITYPILKIINNTDYRISKVALVGYTFDNLSITSTKTFELSNGIPGGNNNVNVNVTYIKYRSVTYTLSKIYNFTNGQTTEIVLSKSGESVVLK